jgi:hypothetical protein
MIFADGLEDLEQLFAQMPDKANQAASLAINDTSRRSALKLARDEIYEQIAFPTGYLTGNRLEISKFAKPQDLEAIVTGRDRPTSLARFASDRRPGTRNVQVQVQKGRTKVLKKAFIVKLRAGRTMDGDTFNVGLAIRLAPGERLMNRTKEGITTSSLGNGVVLLYGPSVDQVFKAVAADISPKVADNLQTEFFRQFSRLLNG